MFTESSVTGTFQSRLRRILGVMIPILITQLCITGMSLFDTVMSGHAGTRELAGVAIGSNIWMPVFTGLNGILQALTPIVANYRGARQFEKISGAVCSGLTLAAALAFGIIAAGSQLLPKILDTMSLEPAVRQVAFRYLGFVAWGILPLFSASILRCFVDSLGYTQVTMRLFLLTMPINACMNYIFIFGKLGMPALGGPGAGVGTAITCWLLFLAFALVVLRLKVFREQLLECHYCGHTEPVPTVCPHCGSKRIKFFGTGTEKAETEIQGLCPGVKPLRMDQDSTSRKFAHERILSEFRSGAYNVLLGTQMVAKGHDIPNVTLVGILSADSQLNLPDFRSGERCFALLTQAAGRAGRGDKPGHVIFQAYDAENPILQLAARQDYEGFAKLELAQRKELGYPPFTRMLKVTVLHKNQEEALATAQKLVNALEAWQLETKQPLEILGPFPAIVARVNQIYRINVLLKSPQLKPVKDWLRQSDFRALPNVLFDVDPMSVV